MCHTATQSSSLGRQDNPVTRNEASVFPLFSDARLRNGIFAIGPGLQGRRRIHRQLVQAGRHLVVAVEHVVVGDFLAGVRGHAAQACHEAGLDAALGFIVGLVVADGVHPR